MTFPSPGDLPDPGIEPACLMSPALAGTFFTISGTWEAQPQLRTLSGGRRKGQSPCELLGGISGFHYRRCPGLRPCLESVPEPEDSSPVLTWILGYFWSLPRGVSPRLEWGHARALTSRAVAAVSCFPSRESREQWLSLEAFPRGFPTRLSHEALPQRYPRATMV